MAGPPGPADRAVVTVDLETTHRLGEDGALCGERAVWLTPCDAAVTCLVCRALLDLEVRQRGRLIRRSMVLLAKPATA